VAEFFIVFTGNHEMLPYIAMMMRRTGRCIGHHQPELQ
jgi:hypothetical protein